MSFCATKGPKTWGITISPKPLKTSSQGRRIEKRVLCWVGGVRFLRFAPFCVTALQGRTQRPNRAEIARKKRELILAISASQWQNFQKRNLSGIKGSFIIEILNKKPPAIASGFSVSAKVLTLLGTHRCVFESFVTDWQKLRLYFLFIDNILFWTTRS